MLQQSHHRVHHALRTLADEAGSCIKDVTGEANAAPAKLGTLKQ